MNFNQGDGNSMIELKIKVKITALIGHLERNKMAHVKGYKSALKIYFKKLSKELAKMATDADASKMRKDDYRLAFERPQNKSKDYDRYIKMLTMSVEPVVEISSTEYNCFVNDEWEWVFHAKTINTFYNSSRSR